MKKTVTTKSNQFIYDQQSIDRFVFVYKSYEQDP